MVLKQLRQLESTRRNVNAIKTMVVGVVIIFLGILLGIFFW